MQDFSLIAGGVCGGKVVESLPSEDSWLQGCTIIRQSTGGHLSKMQVFIASPES